MRRSLVVRWVAALVLGVPQPGRVAPGENAGADWLARAQRAIAAREYHASENTQGLQAPNRRQNFRTYFAPDGIRVVDRTAPGSPRLLDLSLAAFGREGALAPVGVGEVNPREARVEIRRRGLVEWYENRPEGLEQGFTLAERPSGEGGLVLALQVAGATAKRRGGGLVLATETGRKLAYGKLAAWDADHEPLGASLRVAAADRIEIRLDDRGARYPLTIDPLLTETEDTLLEGGEANASFGGAVASAGDVDGDGYRQRRRLGG